MGEQAPAMIVTSQYGYSANMERIMKSQAFADQGRQQYMISRRTIEINPRHPLVTKLLEHVQDDKDSQITTDLSWSLYDAALLNSGFAAEDPEEFASRMYRMMANSMGVDSLDLEEEIDVPEDEEEEDEMDLDAGIDEEL